MCGSFPERFDITGEGETERERERQRGRQSKYYRRVKSARDNRVHSKISQAIFILKYGDNADVSDGENHATWLSRA